MTLGFEDFLRLGALLLSATALFLYVEYWRRSERPRLLQAGLSLALAILLLAYSLMDRAAIELFVLSTLALSCPLVLAAMGGLTSERSGVINIALEGKMLGAAVVSAIVGLHTRNAALGLAAGVAASTLLSLLHWLMTQAYRIDHIISGMAINAIALGLSNYLDRKFSDPGSAAEVPILPLSLYYVLCFTLPIALGLYLARTRGGLHLLAVGQDPGKSRQMGLMPAKVRLGGLLTTGFFCGLAGVLVVSQSARFVDNMTSGRGFIALAALILGGWRPIPAAIACIGFGALQALQIHLQGAQFWGVTIPPEFWQSAPYVATIIALAGFLGRSRVPAGLGKA